MKIRLLDSRARLPQRSTVGSAAVDLHAILDNPLLLLPGVVMPIKTGVAVYIENPHWAGLVLPRSGLGLRGLVLANLVGLIDSDYQGELIINAWNRGGHPIHVRPGDRIAQLTFVRVEHPPFEVVEEFEESDRGGSGWGSTGR